MTYATRPFEYLHLDFMDMPDAANGHSKMLIITDDFSLTTVLHPCEQPLWPRRFWRTDYPITLTVTFYTLMGAPTLTIKWSN